MSRIRSNQSGLASIVIVMMIMIILSTLVLGFSKIIRREQRRSFDRQLSSQAFYAAESGINDAVKALDAGFTEDKTNCEPFAASLGKPPELSGNANKLTADSNVQYSCLLIDTAPTSLVYDNIGTDKSTVFPIESKTGDRLDSVVFGWQDRNTNVSGFRGVSDNNFLTEAEWNAAGTTGVIRLDLIPVGSSFDRNDLLSNVRTYFLYPNADGTGYNASSSPLTVPAMSPDYPSSVSGEIVRGHCNTANSPKKCIVRITGLPTNKAFVRIKSVYRTNTIDITATKADGTPLNLVNAQTLVDSTGKAADVSRRVQVRVPTLQELDLPESVLGTMNSLCKKFSITPVAGALSDNAGDPACNLNP